MRLGFALVLMVMAVWAIHMSITALVNRGSKSNRQNLVFAVMCIGSAVWSAGYGLLVLQNNPGFPSLLCRAVALLGIFLFLDFSVVTYLYWTDVKHNGKLVILTLWILISAVIYPYIVMDDEVQFIMTSFGMSYIIGTSIWRVFYIIFVTVSLLVLIIISLNIFKNNSKVRIRRIVFGMMGCEIACLVGMGYDIKAFAMAEPFFPFNAVAQFIGLICIYRVLIATNRNRISIKNISEFIYYNVEFPILIFDEMGQLAIINRYGMDFFQKEEEECLGCSIARFFYLDPEVLMTEKKVSAVICKNNNAVCNLTISTLYDQFQEILGYMVLITDNSEQIKVLRELEEARAYAEQANNAKSAFLANMSHEIRTPINTVLGMDEMILRENKDENIAKYAMDIMTAGNSLLSLINDILDFSKIESGKMEILPVDYEMNVLLADIISVFSFRAKEKALKFYYDIDPKLPKILYGDDVRIRQIFSNLLSNAIKYTGKGRVIMQVEGHLVDEDTIDICIAVVDTGCGIKKADIHKLFDAFTRIEEKRNRSIEGTGLGLNITYQLVNMMEGTLNVKSTYGRGSTFSCSFRQKIKDNEAIGNFDKYYEKHQCNTYTYHKTFEAPEASVLIVDDNRMNLTVMTNLLKETRMRVVTAHSGIEAVALCKEEYFDVIFMDHMMPQMDGLETFTAIKGDRENLNRNVPIIAMTANAVAGAKQMYLQYGFIDYLSKPINPVRLEQMLMKYLPPRKVQYKNTTMHDWIKEAGKDAAELKRVQKYLENNGINAAEGLRSVNNIITAYQETLKMFVKNSSAKKSKICELLDQKDMKNYAIEVHSLKGSARMIGADNLSEIAYRHEMAGKENKPQLAKDQLEEMLTEWERVIDTLSVYLIQSKLEQEEPEKTVHNKKAIEEADRIARVTDIKEAVEDYNHVLAKKLIENLIEFELPDEIEKMMKKAYRDLEEFNYAEAMQTLGCSEKDH